MGQSWGLGCSCGKPPAANRRTLPVLSSGKANSSRLVCNEESVSSCNSRTQGYLLSGMAGSRDSLGLYLTWHHPLASHLTCQGSSSVPVEQTCQVHVLISDRSREAKWWNMQTGQAWLTPILWRRRWGALKPHSLPVGRSFLWRKPGLHCAKTGDMDPEQTETACPGGRSSKGLSASPAASAMAEDVGASCNLPVVLTVVTPVCFMRNSVIGKGLELVCWDQRPWERGNPTKQDRGFSGARCPQI